MDNLHLRNFHTDDFTAFHALVSDFDVVKMLAMWPFPSDPAFTLSRMNTPQAKAGLFKVIECGGKLAGAIGVVNGHLAYMIAQGFRGRGIATWALRMSVRAAFRGNEYDVITAGVWVGNPASMAVLRKCGFVETGNETAFCKARGCDLESIKFALSRADWAATQPLSIKTDRLIIQPFELADGGQLSALMNDKDIARMMASIAYPFSADRAQGWIADRMFTGNLPFCAKITLKDGTMIGTLGIGGDPVNTSYALGRGYWGMGFATEAMQAFLRDTVAVHNIAEITAGAMFDNLASQSVLQKLGFMRDGEKMHKSSGRLEEAPLFLYRLDTSKIRKK